MGVTKQEAFELVVGLEIHAQLNTESKIFSTDSAAFGGLPNTHISAETLALPGTLPKLNHAVIEKAIRLGLALNCTINTLTAFDRKHYFYADLPKGYQTTQDRLPICVNGYITLSTADGVEKNIRINRIHLEEDAGKSLHDQDAVFSFADFNRAGVPLVEIVTEPDIRSAEDAAAVVSEIRKLVRFLDVGDGNMEEGSLRCDANISIRPVETEAYGTRCEVKNLNSTRNLRTAISFEYQRQQTLISAGQTIVQSTLNFDADLGTTSPMRIKEEANDYRYFADPDLPPVKISAQWLNEITESMPKLPAVIVTELCKDFGISMRDAQLIAEDMPLYTYFSQSMPKVQHVKTLVNWMVGPLRALLAEKNLTIDNWAILPAQLAEMIHLTDSGKITQQQVFQKLIPALEQKPEENVLSVATHLNILINDDQDALEKHIMDVMNGFPEQVSDYKKGKKGVLGLFVGEVMKRAKGTANPKKVNELIIEILEK